MKIQPVNIPLLATIAMLTAFSVVGCKNTIEVKPIRVEPIHMTLDINIRVDRELDEFFEFEKEFEEVPTTSPEAATTAPASPGGAL